MKGKQGTLSRPRFPYLVKIAMNEYMHVECSKQLLAESKGLGMCCCVFF